MMTDEEAGDEIRKKWRLIINGYFACPALLIFGALMLELIYLALAAFVIFGALLLTSGVRRIFHLLPSLTRYLIMTAPAVFILGWIIGKIDAGQATISVLIVAYGILQVISNLSIPPYIEGPPEH